MFFLEKYVVLGPQLRLTKPPPRLVKNAQKWAIPPIFVFFFLVLRCGDPEFFILDYESTNTEEYFSNIFF